MKSIGIAALVAGNAAARRAVISRRPSNASGLISLRCSTGSPSLCVRQMSAASSRSMANKVAHRFPPPPEPRMR
jgi:hypothetical protein